MSSKFVISQQEFEGPLDLLLSLIEERKLLINDFSLSEITENYLQHVKSIESKIDDVTEFIVIASTLILIKSKSLLPDLNLSLEEESAVNDLRERLERYSFFKDLSKHIEKLMRGASLHPTQLKKEIVVSFRPPEGLRAGHLPDIASTLIAAIPQIAKRPQATLKKTLKIKR